MKILLLHLSDIHFKLSNNYLLDKEVALFEAMRNYLAEYDHVFLVISGDIAYSGKEEEYKIAHAFISKLKGNLESYSSKTITSIIIPGNHDCDFALDNKARKNSINAIQRLGELSIDDSVVEQCLCVQENYRKFVAANSEQPIFSDGLTYIYRLTIGSKHVHFHCYNTAYLSEIKEQPGKMYFPITKYDDGLFTKADIVISQFHHPFHWLVPTNRREFMTHIHKVSDFYLTGHEHEFSKSKIDDLDENTVCHIEGGVLQNSEDKYESSFNIIGFNLDDETFLLKPYSWINGQYKPTEMENVWTPYKRSKIKINQKYILSKDFERFLTDIGGQFSHPSKSDIKLSDLYIYPKLRLFNADNNTEDKISFIIEDAESVLANAKDNSKILLFGNENIGKTSLLKCAYQNFYKKGFLPIYINGESIKSSNINDLKNLVRDSFENQYGADKLLDFDQEKNSNLFILIDDIDKNPIKNKANRLKLIKALNSQYSNIILVGNELYTLEEIVAQQKEKSDVFSEYKQYEILEFNYSQRAKLIHKWYKLGNDDFIDDEEVWRKCDVAIKSINTAMGNKIVPNYPIFLLILLQALESNNPHDLKISSYGNYYQLLILRLISERIKDQSELDTYLNYSAELAYFIFSKKTSSISEREFIDFHKFVTSFEKFDLPELSSDDTLHTLKETGVLGTYGDAIEFKYKYVYYYFVAKYLAQNISKQEIKEVISKLCKRLYRTEFANIYMFLIHFSKDVYIIEELIKNAESIFADIPPCNLENDIEKIQGLFTELPKLYLQNRSVQQVRTEDSHKQDEMEKNTESTRQESTIPPNYELDDEINNIDVISMLNQSFKLTEILGQVLKNFHGSIEGPQKLKILEETYLLGLRTLGVFFFVLNDNTDFLLSQLQEILAKIEKVEKSKVEKVAKHLLLNFITQLSHLFLRKISDSVGTGKMMDKYDKIEDKHNTTSVRLVNFLIKLDHANSFPAKDLEKTKDKVNDFPLSYHLLRRIVVNHLHRHEVSYQQKQRICEFLGIPMETQLQLATKRER